MTLDGGDDDDDDDADGAWVGVTTSVVGTGGISVVLLGFE